METNVKNLRLFTQRIVLFGHNIPVDKNMEAQYE